MGLLSFIKRLFSRNTKVKDVEEVMEEIKSNQVDKSCQLSGETKFPKKVGKAEISIETKPKKPARRRNNFRSKNNEFFKDKATKGKRKYSSYNKKNRKNDK